jgi:hypothetical protein
MRVVVIKVRRLNTYFIVDILTEKRRKEMNYFLNQKYVLANLACHKQVSISRFQHP